MSYPSELIAKYFQKIANSEGKTLTHMKIQKLVFFAHGVHLAAFGGPLINEEVKAWKFGPVIPELYDRLYKFGSSIVNLDINDENLTALEDDNNAEESIRVVWKVYGSNSAWTLSEISHRKESPWDIVWNQLGNTFSTIPNSLIEDYYKKFVTTN